jgi:hypothetical protein
MQFYTSAPVLAKRASPGGAPATADSVVVVDEGTPGRVTDAGPDWLRVAFQPGGRGVPFLAVTGRGGDSLYCLATETEGTAFQRLTERPRRDLRQDGVVYQLVYGDDACLLVDEEDLEKVIERRGRVSGWTK